MLIYLIFSKNHIYSDLSISYKRTFMHYQEVRILPMDRQNEFNDREIDDVQTNYFLNEMPSRLKKPENYNGIYCYKSKRMNVLGGGETLVLFQYDNKIIACADLMLDVPNSASNGYAGYYVFSPKSIKVFRPMDSQSIGDIFGKTIKFAQATHKLDPLKCNTFFSQLIDVLQVPDHLKSTIEWSCIPAN